MARRNRPARWGRAADLLVVGLGNPGDEYADTRHNAGKWVVEELARRHDRRFRRALRQHALVAELDLAGRMLALAIPSSYMNESGRAVGQLVRRHGITDLSRLVVVHDELDLPVGRLRVKNGGGSAGHKGLKSIRAQLRTETFSRLRIGVGRPERTPRGGDYVLRRPGSAERAKLDEVVQRAADALEYYSGHSLSQTMNRFNAAT